MTIPIEIGAYCRQLWSTHSLCKHLGQKFGSQVIALYHNEGEIFLYWYKKNAFWADWDFINWHQYDPSLDIDQKVIEINKYKNH